MEAYVVSDTFAYNSNENENVVLVFLSNTMSQQPTFQALMTYVSTAPFSRN